MSQLKVNSISDAAGSNGNAISLASDGTCTVKATNNLSNRNLIINGAFQVAQRGTSNTTDGFGTVDRWKYQYDGTDEAPTQAQHALTSSDTGPWEKGFRYSYHITNGNQTSGAGAGDNVLLSYTLENQDIFGCGWNPVSSSSYLTLSFWVKSSVAQTFHGFLLTPKSTRKLYSFSTGALSANTWTKVTKKIPGDSNIAYDIDNAAGILLRFAVYQGTNKTGTITQDQWATFDSSVRFPDSTSTWYTTNDATWEITGVQLEVSDHPTDFEFRSYADELRRCQRYCFKWSADSHAYSNFATGNVVATSQVYGIFQGLPVPMRAAATLTTSGNFRVWDPDGGANAVTVSMSRGHVYTPTIALTSGATPFTNGKATECGANNDTSAQFTLSAEL